MSELLPVATTGRVRSAVQEMVRPHRRLAITGFGVLVAATATGLATQPLLGHIVDLVAAGRGELLPPIALLVLVAVGAGALTALGLSQVARLGETVLAELRERFVDHALSLPLEQVERAGSGDLTARVSADVTRVAEAVRGALPELARSGLTIVLTMAGLALIDWRFLLAALVAAPVQVLTARWYVRHAVPLYAAQRIATGAQQQQLLDSIAGAATVRAFLLSGEHLDRVGGRSRAAIDLTVRGLRLVLGFYSRLHVAEFAGLAAVVLAGFWMVSTGTAGLGEATAAALYFHGLFGPVNTTLVLLDDAQAASAALARLVGVIDLPAQEPPGRSLPGARVEVRGVSHAYAGGQPVLHEVDLTVGEGERVALVGASGAGKTTLAKLVAGLHPAASGSIGAGEVVMVTQEVHVFAGPLADDLRLARPAASDEELRRALDLVDALDWVEALPDGLATVVGEGGQRLTPAQRQQLALARLVLADPEIAVLDEATAEAGSAGARVLEKAIDRATSGRSALLVAHRLSQAAAADRIVVMDGGRVVESGTHQDLLDSGGRYAGLWSAWTEGRGRG
ncbi:ABC transporter ATP-binding protein [Nonomuraea sp. NPDC050310]|uniref:ABC transporter ATP-binding protein n=1 Tax=Nonomuraea sp. NPDC050310 TaxID=3154935 RepID=UPI0033E713C3